MTPKLFRYGRYKYEYELTRQSRKTLSLTVRPDMSILLKAPVEAEILRINAFLKRKWIWLEKQLRFFKKYERKIYKKEYLSGESFLYLGRQYTLKVVNGSKNSVVLRRGIFKVISTKKSSNKAHNQKALGRWYEKRIEIVFNKIYRSALKKFNYDFIPDVVVRNMAKRWGSYVNHKKIIINPRLIQAPTECIDYVICHELCHMRYKNHSKDFFNYLSSVYPGWEKVKEKLELRLG